ncbi:putative polysaccharide export protein [Caenibius tardaugens NBRC 16725]|uniref:Putative polysaccharide export protein n=1 Tax=Caenibius tardaugens NBRC 16725 TaxID=1219035 RepID=U2YPL2_9SPHN|nr:polysaccharide biosynthesis/export family protein [Caenibius tardaugens]AZI36350.1 polysaccharide export protein [Caenibius tardaugens NBRC 16725]GAD50850.1 putative polysaccharide export protein [Caenibius tardaugens NBRC 16725]
MQLGFIPCHLALIASFALTGCASTPTIGGDPGLRVMDASALPPPTRGDLAHAAPTYFVGPLDKLTIDVFGIPELTMREVQVDASGMMAFPMTGVIDVTGRTPAELQAVLTERLRAAHIRDPQVTVNLKETVSQQITVEGQVRKPGLYPVNGRMTLMKAIARAEGTDEYSRLDDIVVFRTVDGQRMAALYDLSAIRHGAYSDPEIYANDIIMVGDSYSRRLFKDILSVVPALASPIIIGLDRLTK